MLWTEYRHVIKIGPKGSLGSREIRPIHSAPSLGQSIALVSTPARDGDVKQDEKLDKVVKRQYDRR